jgi:predicted dehydrogenase
VGEPLSTGPLSTGPLSTGPLSTGPLSTGPLRVGVVGIGQISRAYLTMLDRLPQVQVTLLTDLIPARAEAGLRHAPSARAVSVTELLESGDVDLVLNLTIPAAHAEVALAALGAGKHVYGEKPLALSLAQGREALARAGDLRVGCAPDTVLGTGTQTARQAIADGLIGTPVAANAVFTTAGHEFWHPDPEFYYQPGGGPLFDMGPYYLSALIHMLGPVQRVTGASSRIRPTRVIGSGPRAGTRFDVEVDTHVAGVLEHSGGVLTTITTSFDVVASNQPRIEIHGTEGSLASPDPNIFGGQVLVWPLGGNEWSPIPTSAGYEQASRGTGVADLAESLAANRPHRASSELALHVLDVMQSLLESAQAGKVLPVTTSCPVPDLVPLTDVFAERLVNPT